MKAARRSPMLTILVAVVTMALVVVAGRNVARLNQIARDSPHSALWLEIRSQLKSREVTGRFPLNLAELPLTFPDGGSAEMLKLFEYRCDGRGCTVSTVLRGRRVSASFGQMPPETELSPDNSRAP